MGFVSHRYYNPLALPLLNYSMPENPHLAIGAIGFPSPDHIDGYPVHTW